MSSMWHVIQAVLIFGVVASKIHWQWTPNRYVSARLGIGLAYYVAMIFTRWPAGGPQQSRRKRRSLKRIASR
jgi:uncharacterized membrane protein YgaE (UPF0421/DUF939 family)